MADVSGAGASWRNYRPSKTAVFWSWIGVSALTMLVGFTWGGWTTGSTAQEMADQARSELAAAVCVQRFMNAPDAKAQLAKFKDTAGWKQDDFIKEGGWAKIQGLDEPISAAASICADKLEDAKLPASQQAASDS